MKTAPPLMITFNQESQRVRERMKSKDFQIFSLWTGFPDQTLPIVRQ